MMNWSYVAGFWDGEGCICIRKGSDILVTACQSTPQDECLREIQKFLYDQGIESKIYIGKENGPRRHPISKIFVTGNRANKLKFMLQMRDLCIVKKAKLEAAIELIQILKYYSTQYDLDEKRRRCEAGCRDYLEGASIVEASRKNHLTRRTLQHYIVEKGLKLRTKNESLCMAWALGKRNGTNTLRKSI